MGNENLLSVNVTVDQIQQGCRLLKRFDLETDKLTEITVINNQKQVPDETTSLRYGAVMLDQLVGEKITDWDGHSPITIFFDRSGAFDHYEKTAGATAGASAT